MTETSQSRIQSFAFVIGGCLCVLLSICFAGSFFVASGRSCEVEIEQTVNPNDAPVESLARLPGLGLVRAEAIVAYRETVREKDCDPRSSRGQTFRDCNDLQKVKGIGPKTAQNISKWLKFQ